MPNSEGPSWPLKPTSSASGGIREAGRPPTRQGIRLPSCETNPIGLAVCKGLPHSTEFILSEVEWAQGKLGAWRRGIRRERLTASLRTGQTKPILAEEASALIVDGGLLMTWDRRLRGPGCVKQSQFAVFRPENEARAGRPSQFREARRLGPAKAGLVMPVAMSGTGRGPTGAKQTQSTGLVSSRR